MRLVAAAAFSIAWFLGFCRVSAESTEARARPTLTSVLQKLAASEGVAAEFVETKNLALLSAPLESRGTIYFVPPDRFARFTTHPAFSALIIDGDHVTFRESQKAEVLDISGSPITRAFVENFIVLWSGDLARLERQYEVGLRVEGDRWEISLAPRATQIKRVIEGVTLQGAGDSLERMIVADRDGDRTETSFRSIQLDRSFSITELERLFESGAPLEGAPGRP